MNVLQKVACVELIVSLVASVVVLLAIPFLGVFRSVDLFALLGVPAVVYPLLIRQGRNRIIRDERDLEIKRCSDYWGSSTAWMFFIISMIVISMWHAKQDVPTKYLFALIWIQFAVYVGVKGAAALLFYRGVGRAA